MLYYHKNRISVVSFGLLFILYQLHDKIEEGFFSFESLNKVFAMKKIMTVEFTKLSKLITCFELKEKVELEILHCKDKKYTYITKKFIHLCDVHV